MKELDFADHLLKKFQDDGFLIMENYYDDELCDKLRHECSLIIDKMNPEEHKTVFETQNDEEHVGDDYFLTSGDKIRFFWETEAVNDKGNLNRPKHIALNKIGHALHFLNPAFKDATFTPELKIILQRLGYIRPVVPQSMYIFKQPNIGGEVTKHVDATFLDNNPRKLTGFWIALEDTTLENGCLYFAPGSHKNVDLNFKMVRNPDKRKRGVIFEGELEYCTDNEFISVPVKKGSMIIIDGLVQHYSAKNISDKSRHIYTFHVAESYQTEWSKKNWLQPTDTPFPVVYDCSATAQKENV
ncbi:phytanoyl-CoA dioxygenase domain-containing protein 1 homolog [Styela clava]